MPRSVADLAPKPKNDAYTVLLTISLAAMIGACLLLWTDIQTYPSLKPTDTNPIQMPKAAAPDTTMIPPAGGPPAGAPLSVPPAGTPPPTTPAKGAPPDTTKPMTPTKAPDQPAKPPDQPKKNP